MTIQLLIDIEYDTMNLINKQRIETTNHYCHNWTKQQQQT